MDWATFYLVCFAVGLALSFLSLAGGFGHFHFLSRWHVPHFLGHHATASHTGGPAQVHVHGPAARGHGVSFFNFSSLMAFLAWFGGTGYLLTRYSTLWGALAFGLALASGTAGATIVFLFLVKVLLAHESNLNPDDFELIGVLGALNAAIRPGGTGEIIFSQGGARRAMAARSEAGEAIPKGTEVVVTSHRKGIAYVKRWSEIAGEDDTRLPAGESKVVG